MLTLRLVLNQKVVVSQLLVTASHINIKKQIKSMISFIYKTQSSTEQRERTTMSLRSSLKCSRKTTRIFIRTQHEFKEAK